MGCCASATPSFKKEESFPRGGKRLRTPPNWSRDPAWLCRQNRTRRHTNTQASIPHEGQCKNYTKHPREPSRQGPNRVAPDGVHIPGPRGEPVAGTRQVNEPEEERTLASPAAAPPQGSGLPFRQARPHRAPGLPASRAHPLCSGEPGRRHPDCTGGRKAHSQRPPSSVQKTGEIYKKQLLELVRASQDRRTQDRYTEIHSTGDFNSGT